MTPRLAITVLAACLLAAPAAQAQAPLVFFDIAAPDMAAQAKFYREIFDWKIAADGRFSVPVTGPMGATLRVEPPNLGPATERLIYIGVPDITATLKEVTALGGSVVFPRTEAKGVVVLALFKDPAGNRMDLVEITDGKPLVP